MKFPPRQHPLHQWPHALDQVLVAGLRQPSQGRAAESLGFFPLLPLASGFLATRNVRWAMAGKLASSQHPRVASYLDAGSTSIGPETNDERN